MYANLAFPPPISALPDITCFHSQWHKILYIFVPVITEFILENMFIWPKFFRKICLYRQICYKGMFCMAKFVMKIFFKLTGLPYLNLKNIYLKIRITTFKPLFGEICFGFFVTCSTIHFIFDIDINPLLVLTVVSFSSRRLRFLKENGSSNVNMVHKNV